MNIKNMFQNLTFKMLLSGGLTFFVCAGLWTGFNIVYLRDFILRSVKSDIIILSETILLGLHYAMLLDSEDDIRQIVNNIAQQEDIKAIRVLNKKGRIAYSSIAEEVGTYLDTSEQSCWACHAHNPPPVTMSQDQRSRIIQSEGAKIVGTITPIPNEPGCIGPPCHVHFEDEKLLGLLDMEVSTEIKGTKLRDFEQANMTISLLVFLATFFVLFMNYHILIFKPVRRLIRATKSICSGEDYQDINIKQADEIGVLADSFNTMCRKVAEKEALLTAQREEYRNLFQNVPCLLSVVDRNYNVIRHNKKYVDHFGSFRGKHCYEINKGKSEKCDICPVELTFMDGFPHVSEEQGLSREGKTIYWIVYTAPIKNADGEIVAAMEMMLDITERKELEFKLAKSELRYHSIFESIPSALFVLDCETLSIMNCNDSVLKIYGYKPEELLGKSFLLLFREEERESWDNKIRVAQEVNQCSQLTKNGKVIFASMRISHSEFDEQKVLIVSCSDVTKKLEAEQQFIHSSKMTTLGEMATGVAHELNQPLAILKSISGFLSRKISKGENLDFHMLEEVAESINTHVNRASKIITHMREFGRKSEPKTTPVQINDVLRRGFEFFSQQLNVRNIKVEWDLQDHLPIIMGDPNRLEQVIINLLVNARDAIEERWDKRSPEFCEKRITIQTRSDDANVTIKICDTGIGIPPAMHEKIFEPFFTTKDVGKGTGLGLSISYGIVQDYKGTITAESLEEGGSCFTIVFPVAGKEEASRTTDS